MPFTGRREIFTSEREVTRANVEQILRQATITHDANAIEINFLYEYYKGNQPVLYRTKKYNDFVCNKIVENRAFEIVNFKTGYLVGEPIQYVSIDDSGAANDNVVELNRMMITDDAAAKNTELVTWQLIGGLGYKMTLPTKEGEDNYGVPYKVNIPDPRQCFVVKRNDVEKTPLMGVYFVTDETNTRTYQCWTRDRVYTIGSSQTVKEEDNPLGYIPIVEYPLNQPRIGVIELVQGLLDAINALDSDRLDGVDQFIQSLLVLTNVDLDEGVDAQDIRENGMLQLPSREGRESKVQILTSELNQAQTQTLKQDLIQAVVEIVGMPSQSDGNTGDSSNNGAVVLKNGWQSTEASAKAHEMMFSRSERDTLKIVLSLCKKIAGIDIPLKDIAIKFTRRNYENLQSKAQVLTTMLGSDKIAPKLAFEHCGMFADAEAAAKESADYVAEQERKKAAVQTEGGDGDAENAA